MSVNNYNKKWWAEIYEYQHLIWPKWAESDADSFEAASFIKTVLDNQKTGRVLDLGCGSGRISCALASNGWEAYGIDISRPLIERARMRAASKSLTKMVGFEVKDFRTAVFNQQFDLVLFWDSTINIWSPQEMAAIIKNACKYLSEKGAIIIQQLNPDFFLLHNKEINFELKDDSVGPGKTKRRYVFDKESSTLLDHVVYFPIKGRAKPLPIQKLHLLKLDELKQLLIAAGCTKIKFAGSDGWGWSDENTLIQQNSAQVVVIGWKNA